VVGALLDAKHLRLILPAQRQIEAGHERLCCQVRGLMSPDDRFDDLRRKEREMHQASDVAIVDTFALRKLRD